MIQLSVKLLVLVVMLAMVAALFGGWKWKGRPSTAGQPSVYAVASAHHGGGGLGHRQPTGWTWE